MKNIFEVSGLENQTQELFETILSRGEPGQPGGMKLERIVSFGQPTPPGTYYDQPWDEWVMVVRGNAVLAYENGHQAGLSEGDYLLLEAGQKHRVEYTSDDCIWLALHFS